MGIDGPLGRYVSTADTSSGQEAITWCQSGFDPRCQAIEYTGRCRSKENTMPNTDHVKYLRIALALFGLIFLVGIYPLTIIWPSGWAWHTGQSDYLQMILGIYATLGVFLLIASRDPLAHRSLIWFTVWSSVVHGGIMAAQSLENPEHIGHLWGDVLALFLVAIVLGLLTPRGAAVAWRTA